MEEQIFVLSLLQTHPQDFYDMCSHDKNNMIIVSFRIKERFFSERRLWSYIEHLLDLFWICPMTELRGDK